MIEGAIITRTAPAIETERMRRTLHCACSARKRPKEATGAIQAQQRTSRLAVESALRRPKVRNKERVSIKKMAAQ